MDCAKCHGALKHRFVKCGQAAYHEECFICDFCAKEIAGQKSVVKDGCRYCWECFEKYHATKCGVCDEVITGAKITAVDTEYHKDCFRCFDCRRSLVDEKYYRGSLEDQGHARIVPLCREHYFSRYGRECAVCHKGVTDHCVQAMNQQMHVDCFRCKQCSKPIEAGSNFYEESGLPLCALCFNGD